MSDTPPDKDGRQRTGRLAELDRRLGAARKAGKPAPRGDRAKYGAMSTAWRMTIELVVAIAVGAAMGLGLDTLFGTMPIFLVVLVLFGFAAGVRMMLRSAEAMQRRRAEAERED